jgi:hypothetical protein
MQTELLARPIAGAREPLSAERLGQVVARIHIERLERLFAVGRQKDGDGPGRRWQTAYDLETIEVW